MTQAADIWLLTALIVMALTAAGWTLGNLMLVFGRPPPAGLRSSASWLKAADAPRRIERLVYRHHHLFGLAVLIGAGWFLLRTTGAGLIWPGEGEPLWHAIYPALTVLNLALIPFGLAMLIRPSLLKRLESAANRWVDWQQGRAAAMARALLGMYCLAALLVLILERLR